MWWLKCNSGHNASPDHHRAGRVETPHPEDMEPHCAAQHVSLISTHYSWFNHKHKLLLFSELITLKCCCMNHKPTDSLPPWNSRNGRPPRDQQWGWCCCMWWSVWMQQESFSWRRFKRRHNSGKNCPSEGGTIGSTAVREQQEQWNKNQTEFLYNYYK